MSVPPMPQTSLGAERIALAPTCCLVIDVAVMEFLRGADITAEQGRRLRRAVAKVGSGSIVEPLHTIDLGDYCQSISYLLNECILIVSVTHNTRRLVSVALVSDLEPPPFSSKFHRFT